MRAVELDTVHCDGCGGVSEYRAFLMTCVLRSPRTVRAGKLIGAIHEPRLAAALIGVTPKT